MAVETASHRFYQAGWLRMCFWVGASASLTSAALHWADTTLWSLLIGLLQFFLAAMLGWFGWAASTRPLFVLSSTEIEVRAPAGPPTSVPWTEVAGLKWENPGAMCLDRQDGSSIPLNISSVGRKQRARLRGLVLRHIELHAPEAAG